MELEYMTQCSYSIALKTDLFLHITRLNEDIAHVYFTQIVADHYGPNVEPPDTEKKTQITIPIPTGYILHNMTTNSPVLEYGGEWLISWASSYIVKHGETAIVSITQPRQQDVRFIQPPEEENVSQ